MKGGYLKWSSAGKPIEAIASPASASMTLGQYKQMIGSTGVVLIDFYAPWCSPCIKMMPTLNKLSAEYKNKVRIETISYDTQKSLARELGIEEIPAFLLYKNGKLIIRKNGYLEEADFRKMLNSAQ
jgi:thioredoxin 1